MAKRAVFFDLDGTLLPMDQDVFTKRYFSLLAKKLAPRGYEAEPLIDGIWKGTAAMVKNDGSRSNEEAFWTTFRAIFGGRVDGDYPVFEEFYREDFNAVKASCGFAAEAAETVGWLKERGKTLVLASNPIFPRIAQENRMRWAGLDPADFDYITSYENSRYCKPNPAYYTEICEKLRLSPSDCIMVGNDAREDLAAQKAGLDVFLLTPCLINRENADISLVPHGDFNALSAYLENI